MTNQDSERDRLLPKHRHVGICRLCKAVTDLTYEHIPPRSAGNTNGKRWQRFSLDAWLEHGAAGRPPDRGVNVVQKGAGGYVYCSNCNSLLGRKYVPEYSMWARAFARHVVDTPAEAAGYTYVEATLPRACPGAFARQVAAILLPLCGQRYAGNDPDLAAAIQGDSRLPNTRLFAMLYRGPLVRHVGASTRLTRQTAGYSTMVLAEVAFPPFALTAILDGAPEDDEFGVEITSWLAENPGDTIGVTFGTTIAEGHSPFPGDYRLLRDFTDPPA